jgi:hypothetical protein
LGEAEAEVEVREELMDWEDNAVVGGVSNLPSFVT